MNALYLLLISLLALGLAYRYYASFLAAKVAVADASRQTPAYEFRDGRDYHPTNKIILFGHHFAAIAGAGPLIGPVLAAQYGYLPGAIWILVGAIFAGCVHDYILLHASVRNGGKSLSCIAQKYLGTTAGWCTALAILFVIVVALAGLAIVVVNALKESSWATFTLLCTVPIAFLMGQWLYKIRPGKVAEVSAIGVVLLLLAVGFGGPVASSDFGRYFVFDEKQIKVGLAVYGFVAAVLPVWMLLCPRDYLSTYLKLGTVALLAVGLVFVHPELRMPATTQFMSGGGPVIPGPVWPYVTITIMCGAISGFHSLIVSGTTPKMLNSESEMKFIGYGAMAVEGFVAVLALIAACVLFQGDYFAISASPEKWAALKMQTVQLDSLSKAIQENLMHRPGGSVTLAVGMASVFSGIPGMKALMAYWYHFAIMFEALFILTTIDTGTRVARFILQEMVGVAYKPFGRTNWMPGVIVSSALICVAWGGLLYGGSISTIWPMFGLANQLLAALGLAIGTSYILQTSAKRVYALTTLLPFVLLVVTTYVAGIKNIQDYLAKAADPALSFTMYTNTALSVAMLALSTVIVIITVRDWMIRRPAPAPDQSAEVASVA
ncbi:MAG: carbon starvation protein A [Armatimonadetes bacterium]|nr:carbon starvation protein A [Armatimonadota bacterium]